MPLPYVSATASSSAVQDDDQLDDQPTTFRGRTFAFFHQLHRGLVKDFAPLANIHLLVLGRGNGGRGPHARQGKEKAARKMRKSMGAGADSSTEEEDTAVDGDEEQEDEVAEEGEEGPQVDGGRPREGSHARAEREAEELSNGSDESSDEEEGVDAAAVKKAVGDADRMMQTSAEGVKATEGIDSAAAALGSSSSISKLR